MNRRALLIADPAVSRYIQRHASYVTPNEGTRTFTSVAADYRCFAQPPRSSTPFALALHTSVFFWPLYHEVFVQDSFVSSQGTPGYLPLGVANHLFFARGQFSALGRTTIRPLFLEPELFAALSEKADGRRMPGATRSAHRGQLLRLVDVGRLWRPMPDAGHHDDESAGPVPASGLPLPVSALDELKRELVEQIRRGRIALWMIDDERDALERTCEALGGDPGTETAEGGFWMMRADVSGRPFITHVATYNALRETLKAGLAERCDGLRVVITDILFRRTLESNGLDLIRDVRRVDDSAVPQTVVVAFTGYGNPLMTAACHHEGADFVVQKAGAYTHGQAPTADPSGRSALIEIFWNVLWLNAVCGFTIGRLTHLKQAMERSGDRARGQDLPGLVADIHDDVDAVFPPGSWFPAVKRWRGTVTELVDEAVHCSRAIASHDVRQVKEVDAWREELLNRLNDFLGRRPARRWE